MQPKVSVIIPIYNTALYLSEALDSICNQTLKEIEIILVNDGSTDNSLNILKKYEPNIILINQENLGQSIARNEGIEIAKGEYVAFVDSDDWVDLDFFEKLYNTAKNHNADIAVAGIIRLHKFGKKFHLKFTEEIAGN